MTKKKLIRNLIVSITSLIFSACLFVTVVFAWFANSNKATVSGISATSELKEFEPHLYRWNTTDEIWTDTNNAIGRILPGQSIYYKLTVQNQSVDTVNVRAMFDGISSNLTADKLQCDGSTVYVIDSLGARFDLYQMMDNKVYVSYLESDGEPSSKLLYSYDGTSLKLEELLIENEVKIYNVITNEQNTGDVTKDFAPVSKGIIKNNLSDSFISEMTVDSTQLGSYVFAIYFEKNENSSFFQYQSLSISTLRVGI